MRRAHHERERERSSMNRMECVHRYDDGERRPTSKHKHVVWSILPG